MKGQVLIVFMLILGISLVVNPATSEINSVLFKSAASVFRRIVLRLLN